MMTTAAVWRSMTVPCAQPRQKLQSKPPEGCWSWSQNRNRSQNCSQNCVRAGAREDLVRSRAREAFGSKKKQA